MVTATDRRNHTAIPITAMAGPQSIQGWQLQNSEGRWQGKQALLAVHAGSWGAYSGGSAGWYVALTALCTALQLAQAWRPAHAEQPGGLGSVFVLWPRSFAQVGLLDIPLKESLKEAHNFERGSCPLRAGHADSCSPAGTSLAQRWSQLCQDTRSPAAHRARHQAQGSSCSPLLSACPSGNACAAPLCSHCPPFIMHMCCPASLCVPPSAACRLH
jgi:hypothetical protein